jgi:hypothetical protein
LVAGIAASFTAPTTGMKRFASRIHFLTEASPPGGEAMNTTAARLAMYEAILSIIDEKRRECGDPSLGAAIERLVLDRHFQEVEGDILENPGAIEPWLIRRRDQ